jgi:hypothetical protein
MGSGRSWVSTADPTKYRRLVRSRTHRLRRQTEQVSGLTLPRYLVEALDQKWVDLHGILGGPMSQAHGPHGGESTDSLARLSEIAPAACDFVQTGSDGASPTFRTTPADPKQYFSAERTQVLYQLAKTFLLPNVPRSVYSE